MKLEYYESNEIAKIVENMCQTSTIPDLEKNYHYAEEILFNTYSTLAQKILRKQKNESK